MEIRKKYTKEFKLNAVSLVVDQNYSRIEASKSLGIKSDLLGRCVKAQEKDKGQAFRGNGKLTSEQGELGRLQLQVNCLEMERDILKKATVFFAKETK